MNIQALLQAAIKEAGLDDDVELKSYSGRNMYGECCVGLIGSRSDCVQVMAQAIWTHHDQVVIEVLDRNASNEDAWIDPHKEHHELINKLMDPHQDHMGFEVVYYWPDVKWEESEDD